MKSLNSVACLCYWSKVSKDHRFNFNRIVFVFFPLLFAFFFLQISGFNFHLWLESTNPADKMEKWSGKWKAHKSRELETANILVLSDSQIPRACSPTSWAYKHQGFNCLLTHNHCHHMQLMQSAPPHVSIDALNKQFVNHLCCLQMV